MSLHDIRRCYVVCDCRFHGHTYSEDVLMVKVPIAKTEIAI